MDWTKAKTILIVALLATNLFLLITYNAVNADDGSKEEALMAETIALLEGKQIYVKGSLPVEHQKMPVLMVEYDRPDPEFLEQRLEGQVPIDKEYISQEEIQKMTEAFIKSCGMWRSNVVLKEIKPNGNETIVSYGNEYEGIPVEDSYMICTVKNGVVSDIDVFWLKPTGFGKSKKATISASAALINLMRGKDDRDAILVEDMEMVYWLDPSDYQGGNAISDTALPAWRITYNEGRIKRIPAYRD